MSARRGYQKRFLLGMALGPQGAMWPVHQSVWILTIYVYFTQEPGRPQVPALVLLPPSLPGASRRAPHAGGAHGAAQSPSRLHPSRGCAERSLLGVLQCFAREFRAHIGAALFSWQSSFTFMNICHALHKQALGKKRHLCHHHYVPGDSTAWWFKHVDSAAGLLGFKSWLYHLLAV